MPHIKFLFKGSPSDWTREEYEEFMQDEFDYLVDEETLPKRENIDGVVHTVVREFDHIGKTRIEFSGHPLGCVWLDGGFGYVQRGYEWLQFNIDELENFE